MFRFVRMHFSKISYSIKTYGCQMNVFDSQLVQQILQQHPESFQQVAIEDSNIILLNTCAVRENAEQRVVQQIKQLKHIYKDKKIGILGCLSRHLKDNLLNEGADLVCGPDSYRSLPYLIEQSVYNDQKVLNVALNDETYQDFDIQKLDECDLKAYVSIMRGCNNMCSFCVVPFTRGRERSMPLNVILDQVKKLRDNGVKEITFLGQNVNSYHDITSECISPHQNSENFQEMYKLRNDPGARFVDLLDKASIEAPEMRFRFVSPHPKDFPMGLLKLIKERDNICKQVHLPAQSGSNKILQLMRRLYTKESYLQLIQNFTQQVPRDQLFISSDFIFGFCQETEEDFQQTLDLIEKVQYDQAFLFAFSLRKKTYAYNELKDDILQEIKLQRLQKGIDLFRKFQIQRAQQFINSYQVILIEKKNERDQQQWTGRTDGAKIAFVPNQKIIQSMSALFKNNANEDKTEIQKGDFILSKVIKATHNTFICTPLCKTSLSEFSNKKHLLSKL